MIDDPKRLPQARQTENVPGAKSGFVSAIDCEQIGTACVILGGGRESKEDSIDPAVGIVLHKKVGDRLAAGEPLATIHFNCEARLQRARQHNHGQLCDRQRCPCDETGPLIHRVIRKIGREALNGAIHRHSRASDDARSGLHFLDQSPRYPA